MASNGLTEFRAVLSDFRQLGSLALKGAIAAPLADIWLKIGPPPSRSIGMLATLLEFLAVIWVFQFWFDAEDRSLRLRMKVALGVFIVSLPSSLVLLERFSVSPGQDKDRVIEGYALQPDVKTLVTSSYTPEQALRESEYDPEKVWTRQSIVVLRAIISGLWILAFVCFAVYLTVFIILQRRRHPVAAVQERSG